jgi:hypothetical protein
MPARLPYGPTLTVEAGLSAAVGSYGAWDAGAWDAATWGPDDLWVDISRWVRSVSTDGGFARDLQAWDGGSATVVLRNEDGRFSPDNPDSPYRTAGVTEIRPWRPVRITATWAGVTWPLWRGYALSWDELYQRPYPGGGGAVVTVRCVDELSKLGRVDGLEQPPAGAGETSGRRVHRVLDAAGHIGARDVAMGVRTLQATTLGDNTAQELALTADSEGGAIWVGADGAVVFADAYALASSPRSATTQAVLGDQPGDLPIADMEVSYDGELVTNVVAWSRKDGTTQTAADAGSRALYGDLRSTRSDLLCEDDAQVAQLAAWHLHQRRAPELRVTSVRIPARRDLARLLPEVLGRRVRDLVRVRRHHPGGHMVDQLCHVASISHDIGRDEWVTTYGLWSATPYRAVGRWDDATWDASVWLF